MCDLAFSQLLNLRRSENEEAGTLLRNNSRIGPINRLRPTTGAPDLGVAARNAGTAGTRALSSSLKPARSVQQPTSFSKSVKYPVWADHTFIMRRGIPAYEAKNDLHLERFFSSSTPSTERSSVAGPSVARAGSSGTEMQLYPLTPPALKLVGDGQTRTLLFEPPPGSPASVLVRRCRNLAHLGGTRS
jgi:hypothetical protein